MISTIKIKSLFQLRPSVIGFVIIFTFLISFFSSKCIAQTESNNSLKDVPWLSKQRFYLGGTGGLSFGDVVYINVAPTIGYRFTDRFSMGVSPKYTFLNYRHYDYKTSIYGGSVFARYFLLNNLYAHAEYEVNNFEALITLPNSAGYRLERLTIPSFLLGGGYFQRFGNSASGFYIQVLYDVLQNPYSPYYQTPAISGGVMFGL